MTRTHRAGATVKALAVGLISLAATTLTNTPVHAQNLFLTSGSYTASDDTYQDYAIYVGVDQNFGTSDPNTNQPYIATLNTVTGASVNYASGFNTSLINVNGGNITEVDGYDTSRVTINNGTVTEVDGYNTSRVVINDGSVNYANAYDNSTVDITGGSVNAAYGYNTSTVNIRGGSITGIYGFGSSVFHLTGGRIDSNTLRFFDNSVLTLFGTGLSFSLNGTGSDGSGSYTAYTLFGTLQEGQSLTNVSVFDYTGFGFFSGNSNALRFQAGVAVAPEPGSIALLVVGTLGLVARRKMTAF